MYRFLVCLLLFCSPAVYAQYPTDQPKIETKEVPEHLQDPLTIWLIIIATASIVFAIIYFVRFDKILNRWVRARRFRR